ncbi:MAG: zinc ribbon domain-containing protein [Clostridiales bacterium]|nr:zinc ribbon domain-containing protein [Clostridiales bacterium]
MFCPNCGSVIPDASKSCPICGAAIEEETPAPEEPVAQPTTEEQYELDNYDIGHVFGGADREDTQAEPKQDSASQPSRQRGAVNWSKLYCNYFYTVYILSGIVAYVSFRIAQAFIYYVPFISVVALITLYLFMTVFLALGIIRLVVGIKTRSKQDNPNKEISRDILIFGISVVVFVYLFIMAFTI